MNVHPRPIVAIVGNARVEEDGPRFQLAKECGRRLIDAGFRLVTGGLGGVMEAASRGARSSESWRDGDIIGILPGSDPTAANPYIDIPIATGMQIARNLIVANASAVIAIGGGAGTLSEIAVAWQLRRPIVALGEHGWAGKLANVQLCKRDRKNGFGNDDRVWPAVDPAEAVRLVTELLEKHPTRPPPF